MKRAPGTVSSWAKVPWYSVPRDSLETLLVGRRVGMMHIVRYLRQGSKVFETYWTTRRGVEAMDNKLSIARLDRLRAAREVGGLAGRRSIMITRQGLGGPPVDTEMKDGFNGDKAILALQRAIRATFDDSRWHELGYLVGKH
jgi:hypothetical protein